jgi:hypothetical protein
VVLSWEVYKWPGYLYDASHRRHDGIIYQNNHYVPVALKHDLAVTALGHVEHKYSLQHVERQAPLQEHHVPQVTTAATAPTNVQRPGTHHAVAAAHGSRRQQPPAPVGAAAARPTAKRMQPDVSDKPSAGGKNPRPTHIAEQQAPAARTLRQGPSTCTANKTQLPQAKAADKHPAQDVNKKSGAACTRARKLRAAVAASGQALISRYPMKQSLLQGSSQQRRPAQPDGAPPDTSPAAPQLLLPMRVLTAGQIPTPRNSPSHENQPGMTVAQACLTRHQPSDVTATSMVTCGWWYSTSGVCKAMRKFHNSSL